jgi:hypothetical protein
MNVGTISFLYFIYFFVYFYEHIFIVQIVHGGIQCANSKYPYTMHCLDCLHQLSPVISSPPHLKQLQEVSPFCLINVYEAHQPYSLTFIPSIHPLIFHEYRTPTHTIPVL